MGRQLDKHYLKWKANYDIAKEYYKKYGTINISRDVVYRDVKLGQWVQVQRLAKNGTGHWRITEKQIKMLEKLEINWGTKTPVNKVINARSKNNLFMELAHDYFDEYGDLLIPIDYVVENVELGKWIKSLRTSYSSVDIDTLTNNPIKASSLVNRLCANSIQRLNDMDMLWKEENKNDWDYKYALAKQYYEEHHNLLIPSNYIANDQYKTNLGNWIRYNRQIYIRDDIEMPKSHIDKLNEIGMVWNTRDFLWEEKYAFAKEYFKQFGNLRIPRDYCVDGYNIGNWIVWQRQARKGNVRNALSQERIDLLNEIGMVWEVFPNKVKSA